MRGINLVLALTAASILGGCFEQKSDKPKVVLGQRASSCDLNVGNLPGTQWVLLQINPDKSETPNNQTRLKIYEEGGSVKAKYTVSSYSDVYTYNCKQQESAGKQELFCKEEPKVKDWYQALYVAGKDTSIEAIRAIDGDVTQTQYDEGAKNAQEIIKKFEGTDKWDSFKFQNNNLGNKLQGLVYLSIDERKCRLMITDMYMTIYDGKRLEDSNPVGTNPMVQSEDELSYEHCTDSADLIPTKTAEFPKSADEAAEAFCAPNHGCFFSTGETAYFQYVGQDGREATEGCTYTFDTWKDWKPGVKGQAAQIVDGKGKKKEVRWTYSTTFDASGPHVVEMVRHWSCPGKPAEQEVSCALVQIP
ncbi:MAG: hypothetical protein ABIO70_36670 [Pseudomonadota bacterium]